MTKTDIWGRGWGLRPNGPNFELKKKENIWHNFVHIF